MSNVITVAAVQMTSGKVLTDNLREAEAGLERAAAGGARLALLPENFAGYGVDYRELATRYDDLLAWLGEQARRHQLYLVAGSLPARYRPDGSEVPAPRVRTRSVLLGPDGEVIAGYDKLHLFDVDVQDSQGRYRESEVFEPGDAVVTAPSAGLTLGMAICYDLRFPLLARALVARGAELLIYPSAFTATTGAAHWELLMRACAVQNGCYVLGANQCGQHSEKRASFGHSMLVDPWGRVVAQAGGEPSVVLGDVDLAILTQVRSALPVHQHQRFTVESFYDLR
ncbi:carbon-nitrogen hydrolase family protein [Alcanivorax balearicus MACL04]|uniref:Carbon-nitrogen hydrolase family protein n=1 Tax=Alloalcanivorax balearicus MACL04 TaxID=1177182 RepID=A0ABT2QWQ9_9GAMM|nr:carbon-nitrogen hydrolase family protein [Alloalcanivorax balearicus]MCU5781951.1 carbon-nitrogen hydrolase family protein [Alloalcanivorax balearicus MACL04]